MKNEPITVSARIHAPLQQVWQRWTAPVSVKKWNHASEDWHTPSAQNDLRVGGEFHYIMVSRDDKHSFDFTGVYTEIIPEKKIAYTLGDGRNVTVAFAEQDGVVLVAETFDPEQENAADMQRAGWQAIVDNFKRYTESR
jgi:uncharacterized protein YndB with AHSA1/START domain